ncbi:hypothetical protein BDK51DRAFT_46258 [Blyttiomyces helicus]|uniref:Uncharacterized protein n=1 Tax=Blyttiomyces helicus TaxID=388810 RepID=A0A4P9WDU5_9FUNG|nr:hypothetical protein BDK51DRAFT_46258 [Blyttiomyces helicus]|eukprot:RKO90881.1 hypothetical protein BDK51DRAFT_46258 [Blyttiomyces helicus]
MNTENFVEDMVPTCRDMIAGLPAEVRSMNMLDFVRKHGTFQDVGEPATAARGKVGKKGKGVKEQTSAVRRPMPRAHEKVPVVATVRFPPHSSPFLWSALCYLNRLAVPLHQARKARQPPATVPAVSNDPLAMETPAQRQRPARADELLMSVNGSPIANPFASRFRMGDAGDDDGDDDDEDDDYNDLNPRDSFAPHFGSSRGRAIASHFPLPTPSSYLPLNAGNAGLTLDSTASLQAALATGVGESNRDEVLRQIAQTHLLLGKVLAQFQQQAI